MSLYDYKMSKEIEAKRYPFYAIIMAAMRQADDVNLEKLKFAFYDTWEELRTRYNSPGGLLEEERR